MASADRRVPKLDLVVPSCDLATKVEYMGMVIAAKMPMIATTIMSSMSVNPRRIPVILLNFFDHKWNLSAMDRFRCGLPFQDGFFHVGIFPAAESTDGI